MTELSVLDRIARALSDDAVVLNLNAITSGLDEWAAEGFDVDHAPDFALDRAKRDALRREYRRRTGERM